MKEIIVNTIIQGKNDVTHGLVVEHNLVIDNLRVVFGDDKAFKIATHMSEQAEGSHLIHRFHQFVLYADVKPNIGFSMKFSDFKNNIDNALDEYLELEAKGWSKEDTVNYVKIVNEIISSPNGTVQMKSLDGLIYI